MIGTPSPRTQQTRHKHPVTPRHGLRPGGASVEPPSIPDESPKEKLRTPARNSVHPPTYLHSSASESAAERMRGERREGAASSAYQRVHNERGSAVYPTPYPASESRAYFDSGARSVGDASARKNDRRPPTSPGRSALQSSSSSSLLSVSSVDVLEQSIKRSRLDPDRPITATKTASVIGRDDFCCRCDRHHHCHRGGSSHRHRDDDVRDAFQDDLPASPRRPASQHYGRDRATAAVEQADRHSGSSFAAPEYIPSATRRPDTAAGRGHSLDGAPPETSFAKQRATDTQAPTVVVDDGYSHWHPPQSACSSFSAHTNDAVNVHGGPAFDGKSTTDDCSAILLEPVAGLSRVSDPRRVRQKRQDSTANNACGSDTCASMVKLKSLNRGIFTI